MTPCGWHFANAPKPFAGLRTGCWMRAKRATFNPFAKSRTGWTARAPQTIECGDVPIERLTDDQLHAIAARWLLHDTDTPKALPPPCKLSQG